jgi:hypothetical protein
MSKKSTSRIRSYSMSTKVSIADVNLNIVLTIQSRIRLNVNLNRMRKLLLGKFFTETANKLVVTMIKSKKDQKKVQKV